jgi:uroporphyrinogen decarboxylase
MAFEKPDRLPFMEFMFFWPETVDRWRTEGLAADADPMTCFGYDPFSWLPVDFNFVPAFTEEVLEETEDMRVIRDVTGVVKQVFKYGSAMPHYLEFPLTGREDFPALCERLDPTDPRRYPPNWDQLVVALRDRDYPVGLVSRGLLAFFRDFMEFTHMCMVFLDDPEWVHQAMDFHTDFLMRLWERVLSEVEVDMIQLGEDMAFKNGPMVSPDFVREFMVPRYRKLADFFRAHGVRTFIVDSDGDIRSLVPLYLEGGVTGVLPLEIAAGMDPVALRDEYPRLQMIGGIDKMKIAKGGDVMRAEVREYLSELRRHCEANGTGA